MAFAKDALGIEPWEMQAAILVAVVEHHQVAIRSGHKVGKSLLIAILALWWACCWPDGKVLITAPSSFQIKDIVWSEITRVAIAARRIGRVFIPEIAIDPGTGIRWSDGRCILGRSTDQPERIQGYSGPACLYLIDEASGVALPIFKALRGNTAGGSLDDPTAVAKFVLTGNPTQTSGFFFDAFHEQSEHWQCFRISSEETPNARLDRIVIPGLATRDFVERIRAEEGDDSDEMRVRVRGEFPRRGGTQVISLETVDLALRRWDSAVYCEQLELGVDVARFGDDESVVAPRRGDRILPLIAVNGFDEHAVASLVIGTAKKLRRPGEPLPRVKIDACGVGLGVASILRQAHDGNGDGLVRVIEVNVSEESDDKERFPNLRSQLWFAAETWLKEGGAIPDDRKLRAELVAPTYSYDERGRRVVEKKKEFKRRLGRSPDRADALCLAVYSPSGSLLGGTAGLPQQSRFGSSRGFG